MQFYKLVGTVAVPCELTEWGRLWGKGGMGTTLKREQVGDGEVSTVFLGMDHGYGLGHEPVLFETMVFGGEHDQLCRRYCTYGEAIEGHAETVNMMKETKV